VERPEQHITDSKGKALLREVFAGLGWAVNPTEEDYGRDFEVEIFRNGKSTGMTFDVQLKSSEEPKYSAGGDFASVSLKTPNARYLALEMRQPILVIQADVAQGRLYWAAPQIDGRLLAIIKNESDAESVTIRIPADNELPGSVEQLITTLGIIQTVLSARWITDIETRAFVVATNVIENSEDLSQSLRDKSDALDLMRLQQLTGENRFEEARTGISAVLSSPQSSIESKFFAIQVEEKNERLAAAAAGLSAADQGKIFSRAAEKMQQLTRKGPPALKYSALLFHTAADFHGLVRTDWGLYLNWKIHQAQNDFWWTAGLRTQRAEIGRRLTLKYRQFLRLVRFSERTSYQQVLPVAFLRIVDGAAILINRLEFEGFPEAASHIRNSVFEICKVSAAIASSVGDEDLLAKAVMSAGLISRDRNDSCVLWAFAEVEKIQNEAVRQHARQSLDDQEHRLNGEELPDDRYKAPVERQVYENMAAAHGIDLSDPDDPFAEMVQVGINDLDPTRVLAECEHLFVTISRRGPGLIFYFVAQQLKLPTMGNKIIHCTLHGYTGEGWTLDDTFKRFQERFCSKCPDKISRPIGWQYTPEWQESENEKNRAFLATPMYPTRAPMPAPPPPPPDIWESTEDESDETSGAS
jgi:hypothetical protein